MSATILYRQVEPIDGCDLEILAPSSFIARMNKAFGMFPVVLHSGDIATLNGMAAMEPDERNCFTKLIEAIEKLENIEVYAQY